MHVPATHFLRAALLLALGALAAAPGCRGQRSGQPPIHPNQNMDQVSRFDPQEPYAFFADGRSSRPQVAGTVAHGELYEDTHLYEGLVNGVLATALPPQIALDEALLQHGRERFEIYCSPCHGDAGYSDGIVVSRGLVQPPSFHDMRLRNEPLGHFFQVATNGIRTMQPYRYQIPVQDRWAIAAYIRALQISQVAALE